MRSRRRWTAVSCPASPRPSSTSRERSLGSCGRAQSRRRARWRGSSRSASQNPYGVATPRLPMAAYGPRMPRSRCHHRLGPSRARTAGSRLRLRGSADGDHGAGQRPGRNVGDTARHGQPRWPGDHVVLRVRHLDALRHRRRRHRAPVGHRESRRCVGAHRALAGDDVSLPAGGQELGRRRPAERTGSSRPHRPPGRRHRQRLRRRLDLARPWRARSIPTALTTSWYVEYGTSTSYGTKTTTTRCRQRARPPNAVSRRAHRPQGGNDLPLPRRAHEQRGTARGADRTFQTVADRSPT